MQGWEAMPNLHYVTVRKQLCDGRARGKASKRVPGTGGRSGGKRASRSSWYERHGTPAG